MPKLAFEILKESIISKGFEPLFGEEEYKNFTQSLLIKCLQCGHEQKKIIGNFRKKGNVACDKCNTIKRRKLTYEQLKEILNSKGFEPNFLYENYKDSNQKLSIKCIDCGNIQQKKVKRFIEDGKIITCKKCGKNRKHLSLEKIKNILFIKGFELEPDFKYEDYKNNHLPINVSCIKCGHKQKKNIHFEKEKNVPCENCRPSKTQRLDFEEVIKKIQDKGFKALFKEEDYKNARQILSVQCISCGCVQEKVIINFKSNRNISCKKCNPLRLTFEQIEKSLKEQNFEPLTDGQNYDYKNNEQYLLVSCLKCGHIQNKKIAYFRHQSVACEKCGRASSNEEKQVVDFISSLNIDYISRDRKTIGKELDIIIPSRNFAIEYNGLYWHREEQVGKTYHLNKTALCKEKGIQLFHIFSDEWLNKPEIVKSMLKQRLGLIDVKIPAKKCLIRQISVLESKQFFEDNHIDGHTRSIANFGLFYQNELIMAVSLRKPFHKKYSNSIEIARMATKLDTIVIGGFSKLLKIVKRYANEQSYKQIITYADLRFGEGNVYLQNSFEKQPFNKILNYWYSNNYSRMNRFKFRAQNGLTEKQVAEQNKVYKVYGCGNNFFIMDLSIK